MVPNVWNIWPGLAKAVKKAHEVAQTAGSGHDFDHDLSVAQTAVFVAWETNEYLANLAGAAGLCHSVDWIMTAKSGIGKAGNVSKVSRGEAAALIYYLLRENTELQEHEKDIVVDAVMNHGKRNEPSDSLVLMALTDADRIVNMEATVIIRAGQHQKELQPIDPVYFEEDPSDRDAGAKYANPRSVLWDIANCATWADPASPYALRLPKAKALGKRRSEFLLRFVQEIKDQRKELGLVPYPEI